VGHLKSFSKAMQYIKSQYASKYHEKYKISGPIWRDRFKSLLIEDEHYLHACGRYIEGNPLRAGMVAKISDWPFSSSRYYDQGKADDLLDEYEDYSRIRRDVQICLEEQEFFEKGKVVGSAFFRFQFMKSNQAF